MPNINEIIAKPGIERATLTVLLRNKNKVIEASADNLYSEHFSVKGHQIIYSVLVMLSQSSDVNVFDSILIYNAINEPKAKASIDDLGGMEYIDMLMVSPVADNLSFYIAQLKEAQLLRMTYLLADDVQKQILEEGENSSAEEILQKLQEKILDVSLQQGDTQEVKKFGETTRERLRRRLEDPTEVLGFQVGWNVWDRVTQGYCSNDLTVIVGESKTGKSTFLLNHAKILSVDNGLPGLYIDTEMDTEEQEDRLVSMISSVPFEEIRNGMFGVDSEYGTAEEKIRAVEEATAKLEASPFYHVYVPAFTTDKVTALVRRYKTQYNIQYFVFDYIKLPESDVRSLQTAQEWQRLGFFTSSLKNLCGICGIPGITAAQANRSSIGNTNQNENSIGGSYRIIQIATKIVYLRNKLPHEMEQEQMRLGNQVLKIGLQRHGSSSGTEIDIQFDKPILRMREVGLRNDFS